MSNPFQYVDPELMSKFRNYNARNPEVYEQFRDLALEMVNTGRDQYSAWAIINVIRWNTDLKSGEEFKISNDYIALFARLFMSEYPKYKGFFRTKPMKGEPR